MYQDKLKAKTYEAKNIFVSFEENPYQGTDQINIKAVFYINENNARKEITVIDFGLILNEPYNEENIKPKRLYSAWYIDPDLEEITQSDFIDKLKEINIIESWKNGELVNKELPAEEQTEPIINIGSTTASDITEEKFDASPSLDRLKETSEDPILKKGLPATTVDEEFIGAIKDSFSCCMSCSSEQEPEIKTEISNHRTSSWPRLIRTNSLKLPKNALKLMGAGIVIGTVATVGAFFIAKKQVKKVTNHVRNKRKKI